MKTLLPIVLAFFLLQSCIPLRIAPAISNYKVTEGKKFKRSLSKRQMFIFEDPKQAGDFYEYVNTKFELEHQSVYDDVPFLLREKQYFFAFYEIDIPDKVLNLAPMVADALWNEVVYDGEEETRGMQPQDVLRKGNWYIAIEVYSDTEKDCLVKDSLSRETVLKYLSTLKKEYLATHNYNEVVFKN